MIVKSIDPPYYIQFHTLRRSRTGSSVPDAV